MLTGKAVVLGVSGSIAAYKAVNIARGLKKLGCDVNVIMTQNAVNFIGPITFESLTGNKCLIDTFDRNFKYSVEHVALAKRADAVLIAPASADVIGKIACGIADDMLTTTVMACTCRKLIAPAMNHNMYHNPIVQDNMKRLESYGYSIIAPDRGMLANGDVGDGRMPDEQLLIDHIVHAIAYEKDLTGKRILVTAGATRESIDPVRFITNHSSGKMGIAVANAAARRGAEVTLVAAHCDVPFPNFVSVVNVVTADDMMREVAARAEEQDIIIKAAAVADYAPLCISDSKIKKSDGDMSIPLRRTEDILKYLGQRRRKGQLICGFSMETDNVIENSKKKLTAKNCDMICANSLRTDGAGFGEDTNVITLITQKEEKELPIMTKDEAAHRILNELISMI